MTDFIDLARLAGAVALLTLPPIALARWLSGGDGSGLADLFAIPVDPPWPRGVQEEEPVQWRVELLGPATMARRVAGPSPTRARPDGCVGDGLPLPATRATACPRRPSARRSTGSP